MTHVGILSKEHTRQIKKFFCKQQHKHQPPDCICVTQRGGTVAMKTTTPLSPALRRFEYQKLLAFARSVWSRLHVSQGWIQLLFVSLTPPPSPPRLHKEKWKLLWKRLGLISLTSDKTDGVKLTTRTQERRASENVALFGWEQNPKTIRLLLLLLLFCDIYHKISKSISLFLLQPAYKCQSVTFYFLTLIASVRIFSLLFFFGLLAFEEILNRQAGQLQPIRMTKKF